MSVAEGTLAVGKLAVMFVPRGVFRVGGFSWKGSCLNGHMGSINRYASVSERRKDEE